MDSLLKGKKILLLYAKFFGYDVLVKEKLEELGASVDLFDARANINSFEKALRKINDSFYFRKQRIFHERIQKQLCDNSYDFIFSNDVLDKEIIIKYRHIFPHAFFVLYLDDSISNMKGVEETFDFYDRVLTFDKKDSEYYGIDFRPLFFVDYFSRFRERKTQICYDLCFVGTCHSDRLSIISNIKEQNQSLRFYFFCYLQSWFMYYYHYALESTYRKMPKSFFQFNPLSIASVAEVMLKSKAILDIQHPAQTGLTMRTIETLGLGKKLITTNSDIANYDFYDSRNILIIDRNNPVIPKSFFQEESICLPDNLYQKYSLKGWIDEVFKTTKVEQQS